MVYGHRYSPVWCRWIPSVSQILRAVAIYKLPDLHMGMCRTISAKTHATHERNRVRLDALTANLAAVSELVQRMYNVMELEEALSPGRWKLSMMRHHGQH